MDGIVGAIEIFEGVDGWRWRMRARNGEILATSEAYSDRYEAEKTAREVKGQMGGSVALDTLNALGD